MGCAAVRLTNLAWKHLFVVNVGLDPRHQLLNVGRRRHLCGLLVVVVILPEVFEPDNSFSQKPISIQDAYFLNILVGGLHLGA